MEWTSIASAEISIPIPDYICDLWRAQHIVNQAERSVNMKRLQQRYERAITTGLRNVLTDSSDLIKLAKANPGKDYSGALRHKIEMLEHSRKHSFLKGYYSTIDRRVAELRNLLG